MPALVCAAALAGGLVACGGSDGGTGGSASPEAQGITGAKVIDVNSMNKAPKGTITYCAGKDTSGGLTQAVKDYNAEYGAQGYKARLFEFPESADEQRNQFIQREQAKSADCDVFHSDVVWTAEFAAQKWLYDMTPYVRKRASEFIPSTFATAKYEGKIWAMPFLTNAPFIYYRSDQVTSPPATWQELYKQAAATNGIVYQGAAYEGLTCDFLDLAFAAGGQVLSADGKKSVIDSAANAKALQFMVDGLKDGAAPAAVRTYMEEPARLAFEGGNATFMRNWVYAYALGQKAPKVKGKFKVMPLPAFQGGGRAGILGGANLVISAYSKNPGAALRFIDYMTKPAVQIKLASDYAQVPVLKGVYDDPGLQKALPFSRELLQAIEQAKSRPVSPVYPQISQAIYKNVNAALAGRTSPQDALKRAQSDIDKALATF